MKKISRRRRIAAVLQYMPRRQCRQIMGKGGAGICRL